MALEETLADEGFDLLAEKGDLGWTNGHPALSTLRLRVSTEPMSSIGHGCDVLAFLAMDADELRSCGLVQGSVLLAETRTIAHIPPQAIPAVAITYSGPIHRSQFPVREEILRAGNDCHRRISDRAQRYTALVKSWTRLEPTTLMSMPGDGLTPLDVLLREGLGT
jgi:hypothetical protein